MPHHPAVHLQALRSRLAAPSSGKWQVRLDAPALSVMTDFAERRLVAVETGLQVDKALTTMKNAGVRAAFVMDPAEGKVLGLVTSYDILGEKPVRYLQSVGCTELTCSRDDVEVQHVMDPAAEWLVARMEEVEMATVGSLLEAFRLSGRTHIAVVEGASGEEPRLRGLFSAAKLMRLTEEHRRLQPVPGQAHAASGRRLAS